MFDPAAARQAHAAGVGASIDMALGTAVPTFTGKLSDPPVQGRFKVLSLSDGVVPMHGPMTAGGTAHLGLSAGLEIDGIRVNVVSGQCQMLDLDLFRFLGVEPETHEAAGEQELGALPRRVHADRLAHPGGGGAGSDGRRPGHHALEKPARQSCAQPLKLRGTSNFHNERTRTMSRIWFSKGLRGMLAKRIQSDLLRAGFTAGPVDKFVDGDFGGNTETALKALQARRGLVGQRRGGCQHLAAAHHRAAAHAVRTLPGHHRAVRRPRLRLAARQLRRRRVDLGHHRFHAEEQGSAGAAGRGRGRAFRARWTGCLGRWPPRWRSVVQKPLNEQIAWADSISFGASKSNVPAEWRDAFARLGEEPIVKRLQMQRAYDRYFVPAVRAANTLRPAKRAWRRPGLRRARAERRL